MTSGTPDRRLPAVVAALMLLSGLMLGVIGSFLVPLRLPGGLEGLSVLIALLGNGVLGVLAGCLMRSTRVAAMPGIGWFVALIVILSYHPGNDIVLPGKLQNDPGVPVVGDLFMVAGLVGIVAAVLLTARFINRGHRPTPMG